MNFWEALVWVCGICCGTPVALFVVFVLTLIVGRLLGVVAPSVERTEQADDEDDWGNTPRWGTP